MPLKLTEKHLADLFEKPNRWQQTKDAFWSALKFFTNFVFFFFLFFLLINFPAYWKKISFNILGQEKYSQKLSDEDKKIIEPIKKTPIQPAQTDNQAPILTAQNLPQNRLVIPKIKVNASIEWQTTPENILEKIKNGVAHYADTQLPGENGNVFVTGHSSNFWWDDGKYKEIFALLDKMEIGDKIYITYEKILYTYEVENKKIVAPTQIEVLNPTDHSILSLMTCYPVGTTINRLVIQAKQIAPVPKGALEKTNTSDKTKYLPVIR
ncbi:MAG: putative sortase [Candidatus Berkelbacteria bacterium Licking1014_7]|uniref:Putative sortase n=1 Tax=Candidatus Berkelbacteria bacterium Licking1014_7 TaxID=2017147 RepID=A0A554LJV2_9BACT|nr:MAG: putative sortase [Candidatus Berkelbacteria bacterium Licking1014_7]